MVRHCLTDEHVNVSFIFKYGYAIHIYNDVYIDTNKVIVYVKCTYIQVRTFYIQELIIMPKRRIQQNLDKKVKLFKRKIYDNY